MRARVVRAWTSGAAVALIGMLGGLAMMAIAVSADDGGTGDGGCPTATATATATTTQAATEQSNAAGKISLQSTDDQGDSADCPKGGSDEEAPGNSGAAHTCPFGGEEGESGESFRNHGECVSEAAHRRNEERRAAKHGTPTPTGTPTAMPTATPTGTGSATAAGTAGSSHGKPDHEDNNGRHGSGGRGRR